MSVQACPGVSFVNSNLLEKRFQVFRSEDKMQNMPADSKALFKRNMINRYKDHPNTKLAYGKYQNDDEMCFAEFLSNCCVDIKNKEFNNTEPTVLNKLGRGVLVDDSINSENLS